MASDNVKPAVYVGPRPFKTGERLFGRDREVMALSSLLIAERVVLLYAPSGAGKTSLVQAGLVPELRRADFDVPPVGPPVDPADPDAVVVIRVHLPPPAEAASANRYLLSTLLSLEQHRPKANRRGAAALAEWTLPAYLAAEFPACLRKPGEGEGFRPLVLLFDQMEEVLTLDPTDTEAKRTFFTAAGEVLRERGRWALFVIREDHVAALEPYLPLLPGELAARYRVDRLGYKAALEAIREPAEAAGITFVQSADGITFEKSADIMIVDDLRQVRVQQPDGSFLPKTGPYVEPVHLQVICLSLWDMKQKQKPEDRMKITPNDLKSLAEQGGRPGQGVDAVLALYYRQRVEAAAAAGPVSERRVRDWFGEQLITRAGTRRPALSGEEVGYGINDACREVLDKAYLIRAEMRGGATWYELAHDRLIDPVRQDNDRWRSEHLTTFQQQAELWARTQGNRADLLVEGKILEDGERWAEAHAGELTPEEQQFLRACREKRATRQREQEQERLQLEQERLRLEQERLRREKDQAEVLARTQRSYTLFWRTAVIIVGVLLAATIGLAIRAFELAHKYKDALNTAKVEQERAAASQDLVLQEAQAKLQALAKAASTQQRLDNTIGWQNPGMKDNRRLVSNPAEPPWHAVCALSMTAPDGSRWAATGFLIAPRVVLTAAYAVYLPRHGGWATKVEVKTPGTETVGSQVAVSTTLRCTAGWIKQQNANESYGAVLLPAPFKGVEPLRLAPLSDAELTNAAVVLPAYPADKPGGTMWSSAGKITEVKADTLVYNLFTVAGMSGGPLLLDGGKEGRVVGLHNLGGVPGKSGIRLTDKVLKNLKTWIDESNAGARND